VSQRKSGHSAAGLEEGAFYWKTNGWPGRKTISLNPLPQTCILFILLQLQYMAGAMKLHFEG
jgi:hypothetical protein